MAVGPQSGGETVEHHHPLSKCCNLSAEDWMADLMKDIRSTVICMRCKVWRYSLFAAPHREITCKTKHCHRMVLCCTLHDVKSEFCSPYGVDKREDGDNAHNAHNPYGVRLRVFPTLEHSFWTRSSQSDSCIPPLNLYFASTTPTSSINHFGLFVLTSACVSTMNCL